MDRVDRALDELCAFITLLLIEGGLSSNSNIVLPIEGLVPMLERMLVLDYLKSFNI